MARKREAGDDDVSPLAAAMAARRGTTVHKPRAKKMASAARAPSNAGSLASSSAASGTPSAPSDVAPPASRPSKKRKSQPAATANGATAARTVEKKKSVEPPSTSTYFTASQLDVEIGSVDDTAEDDDDLDEEEDDDSEHNNRGTAMDMRVEDEEEGDDEEEDEIAAPVVFQCGTCRSIFGDSYAFVSSNAELLLVTLSAVTNVAVGPEPLTSKEGPDLGSSFLELLCKQCQTVLGRQYLTTPLALDPIRSLYSFSTSCIASYQLGYPQLSQAAAGGTAPPSVDEIKQANDACVDAVNVLSMDRQELLRLREEMTKVQDLLLVVDERLHDLETQANDSEDEEDDDAARRST
ncbi:hypothetical protein P43SY_008708 [Pythium insidiosum]|uniref:Mis18 domain-containing protein n=1 Tax=Pythium insidiosum TaxID=114742 RepID=A0AAD5M6T7_PYTIN|nr:hypothetical protein P43SY_008708 [Pythium insidiosum]